MDVFLSVSYYLELVVALHQNSTAGDVDLAETEPGEESSDSVAIIDAQPQIPFQEITNACNAKSALPICQQNAAIKMDHLSALPKIDHKLKAWLKKYHTQVKL